MVISKDEIKRIYYEEYLFGHSAIYLSEKYGLSDHYLYRWFNKLGLPLRSNKVNSKKYNFNENYFQNIDTKDKAYWLGFIYADGYITQKRKHTSKSLGVAICVNDKNHLHKLNKCLESNVSVCEYVSQGCISKGYKKSKYCRVLYSSDKLADDLIKNGVHIQKTNILQSPKIDYELTKDFIRGYLDGDGSIWKQDKSIQFNVSFVGTDEILNYIMSYLIENKVLLREYPLNKRKPNHIVSNFKFGGNLNSFRVLDFLYKDANMYLDRKYQLYLELKELINSRS